MVEIQPIGVAPVPAALAEGDPELGVPAARPVKYRVDVLAAGETRWATNAQRFDTEQEGLIYARDLYGRWTLVEKMRIVPDTIPDSETYVAGSEHPEWTR